MNYQEKLSEFITEVERDYENYTQYDWDVISKKLSEFKIEYESSYDSFNSEERAEINSLFGRYDAAYAKWTISNGINNFKKKAEDLGNWIEGVTKSILQDDTTSSEHSSNKNQL